MSNIELLPTTSPFGLSSGPIIRSMVPCLTSYFDRQSHKSVQQSMDPCTGDSTAFDLTLGLDGIIKRHGRWSELALLLSSHWMR